MRVYVQPEPEDLSRAMYRVANALTVHAPARIEIVDDLADADLQVLHTIGLGAWRWIEAPRYAMIQYCLTSAPPTPDSPRTFDGLWADAELVWSYYPIEHRLNGTPFYHAPLGIDHEFTKSALPTNRTVDVVTSGYVSSAHGEAIEEVAIAAGQLDKTVVHVGPPSVVYPSPPGWNSVSGIKDPVLAALYRRAKWVSGLRHTEGFELPCVEGLACGARPIVFDRPDMRQWYDGLAVFVPECHGDALVDELVKVLSTTPDPVTDNERSRVLDVFDWSKIAAGFWECV